MPLLLLLLLLLPLLLLLLYSSLLLELKSAESELLLSYLLDVCKSLGSAPASASSASASAAADSATRLGICSRLASDSRDASDSDSDCELVSARDGVPDESCVLKDLSEAAPVVCSIASDIDSDAALPMEPDDFILLYTLQQKDANETSFALASPLDASHCLDACMA